MKYEILCRTPKSSSTDYKHINGCSISEVDFYDVLQLRAHRKEACLSHVGETRLEHVTEVGLYT